MSGYAWVTLATNDSYSLGALVLAHSLRQVGTAHQLAVLVTPGVTNVMRKNLADVFNVVEEVNLFDSKDEANLRLLKRPELGVTFTKLHCWRLTQFEKCVFLDADVLVLVNSDELFERDEFSAAPDVGWPDCFNSGVFVYRPSLETYTKLVDFAIQKGSFDGGDQGLLNAYFSDWAHKDISKHLPFIYNMCSTATYSYLPAFKYYGANAKIIHFIGPAKPWLQYFDTESRQVHASPDLQHLHDVLQKWWDTFCSVIHPKLSPDMSGLAGAFAQFTLGTKRSSTQDALENHLRRQAWEGGNIDYLGRDSFDNIWSKICQTLSSTQLEAAPVKDGAFSSDTPQTPEVVTDIKSDVQEVEKVPEVIQQEEIKSESVEPKILEAPTSDVSDPPKEETELTQTPAPEKTISEPAETEPFEISKPDDILKVDVPAVQETTLQKEEIKLEETIEKPAEIPTSDDKPKEEVTVVPEAAEIVEKLAEVPKSDDKPKEEATVIEKAADQVETVSEQSASTEVPKSDDKPKEVSSAEEVSQKGDKVEDIKSEATTDAHKVEAQPETVTEIVEKKLEDIKPDNLVETTESVIADIGQSEAVIAKDEKTEIPPETPEEIIPPKDEIKLEEIKAETPATESEQKVEDTVSVPPEVTEEKSVLSEETLTQKEESKIPTAIPEAPKEEIIAAPPVEPVEKEAEPIPDAPKEEIKETPVAQEAVVKKEETSEVISKPESPKEEIKETPAAQEPVVKKEETVEVKSKPESPKEEKKETPAVQEPVAKKEETSAVKSKAETPKEEIKETPSPPKRVVKKPKPEASKEEIKEAPPAQEPVSKKEQSSEVKPKKAADVAKVETKPELSKEASKTESATPQETAQTEAQAEGSAPVPKDAKPKEIKKKKKIIKKVVKADPTAESSEGSSKK